MLPGEESGRVRAAVIFIQGARGSRISKTGLSDLNQLPGRNLKKKAGLNGRPYKQV